MARLVFERALKIEPTSGEIVSYWPERVSLPHLAQNYLDGPPFFSASYMNHPGAVSGNILKLAWLTPYAPEDLYAARELSGGRGLVYAGVDTTEGSETDTADHCAMMAGERHGPRLFLTAYRAGKWGVETQAQKIDDWLDSVEPNLTSVEDKVALGYVFRMLSSEVNGGRGTRHAFQIVKPPGTGAGAKTARFMALGARFSGQRVLVPGIRNEEGILTIDPRWQPFVEQWTTFPAGHDDLIDAAYWCVETAFGVPTGAARMLNAPEVGARRATSELCTNMAHTAGRAGLPITECERCMIRKDEENRLNQRGAPNAMTLFDGSQVDTSSPIGYPSRYRRSVGAQMRRGQWRG